MKKNLSKILSIILASLLLISVLPLSVFAAPASDLPENMIDSPILRALEYTGYDVQAQKDDGTLYQSGSYGSRIPSGILSGINYGTALSGKETVADSSTITGLAPDIAKFKQHGLCCAAFVTYYVCNYLPNIEGADTQFITDAINATGMNSQAVVTWQTALNRLVNAGELEKIGTSSSNVDRSKLAPGDLVIFGNASNSHTHVAVYSGTYKGTDFMIHVGNDRGPEILPIWWLADGSGGKETAEPNAYYLIPESVIQNQGAIEVYKKNPAGAALAGAYFTATSVKDSALQYLIGPTDSNGYAISNERMPYGEYIVKETVYPTNYTDNGQTEWRVTINNSTPTVTLNVVNNYQYGAVKVTKTSEDVINWDMTFKLTGTSVYGDSISKTAMTDSRGVAIFTGLPIGNYVVEEINVDYRYVIPKPQSVTVKFNETAELNFYNSLKKCRIEVHKIDYDLAFAPSLDRSIWTGDYTDKRGLSQGDATLEGAVYGLYDGSDLVATYTTDKNGYFITDYYPCGPDWCIKEITPSEGYKLNTENVFLDNEAKHFTEEFNTIGISVFEEMKYGQIMLTKHLGDGDTQIETPEVGAEFEIYLKSAGSYENAKDTERQRLTIDAHGNAYSDMLPYGTYTVRQTKGEEGYKMAEPFDVFIQEDWGFYSFIINDPLIKAHIDIVKKDAETGNVIPVAGVGFKVKDLKSGEFITQHISYPTPTDIDIFYTDATGKLRLPAQLPYGEYELIEQCTANGYVLDDTPVKFTVDGSSDVVTVVKNNMPQKGQITIEKKGEVFSTVKEEDGKHIPVFEIKGLEGAEFKITAAEDIYTPDGTKRFEKGQIVDTVTTGTDGTATSTQLYLGKYTVTETKAPYGMVINPTPTEVTLAYAGETVAVTTENISINNERQKVVISLLKELEKDGTFVIGAADEYKNIKFGLFADEIIISADGTEIPKDGLLEIISIDENGNGVFSADIPVGAKLYIKEIETDSHYILSDVKYPVEFTYQDSSLAVVQLLVNNGEVISNKIIRGKVEGTKTDEEGNPIAGVVFGLFKAEETEFNKDSAIVIAETDETGAFQFDYIPYGDWIVKELSCPEQYVMSDQSYDISITENCQSVPIKVVNRKVIGSVKVIKLNKADTEQRLSGAEFELYQDTDGNGSYDPNIDVFLGKLAESEIGTYEFFGLLYGGYFLYESKAPEEFIRDERYFYFEIKEDGKAVVIENEKGVGFINEPVPVEITSPQTGDSSNLLGYVIMAIVSLILLIICLFNLRKKESKT